jgi:hypothetical protein
MFLVFLPTNITLQFGDTGDFVAELQRRLSKLDLLSEAMVNAAFDGSTVNAVKSFQSIHGLRVDGVAGPETLRRLAGVLSGESSSSTGGDNKQEEQKQQVRDAVFFQQTLQQGASGEPSLEALLSEAAARNRPEPPIAAEPSATAPSSAPPPPRPESATQRTATDLLNDMLAQQSVAASPAMLPHTEARAEMKLAPGAEQKQEPAGRAPAGGGKAEEPKRDMEPPEPRRSFSAFFQKIVDYIESKLPRHITQEVKEIGQSMLRAGVREASGALDAPARGQELEAGRGAQAQTPQRG